MLLLCQRSIPSFLGFTHLYFSRYQLIPFRGLPVCTSLNINSFLFGVCPSVLLQISTPSFLGFARLYFSNYQLLSFWGLPVCTSPTINSFLFGVCPSVLLQISIPSFLGLRLRVAPLYPYAIIPFFVCHSLGPGCTRPRGSGCVQTRHTYWDVSVVLDQSPSNWARA